MKIISFNVNGIRAIAQKNFFEDMESHNPDIICLQETKATAEQVKDTAMKSMQTKPLKKDIPVQQY
jgi:exodeoxyribonuclease III